MYSEHAVSELQVVFRQVLQEVCQIYRMRRYLFFIILTIKMAIVKFLKNCLRKGAALHTVTITIQLAFASNIVFYFQAWFLRDTDGFRSGKYFL
jgi:hypothetical protein